MPPANFPGGDGSVFVLTITAGVPGTRAGPTVVGAVCVRSVSCAWPVYTVRMWANAQPPSSDSILVLAEAPSCPTPREVEYVDLRSILCVPSQYLVVAGPNRQMHFYICIEKTERQL